MCRWKMFDVFSAELEDIWLLCFTVGAMPAYERIQHRITEELYNEKIDSWRPGHNTT